MIVNNYVTSDKHILVYSLNSQEKIDFHVHTWPHTLLCIMGKANYFDEHGNTAILDSSISNHEVIAPANVSHGFSAINGFCIVLNITNKKDM